MKAMKKKLRKFLLMLSCGLLLMSLSVGVTVAYLTDTDTVENTFTVGKVDITMDENPVDTETGKKMPNPSQRVTENEYKIVPGRTIDKDPTIHVQEDSEASWLFVKIDNALAAIEAADEDYTCLADQIVANGWTLLEGPTDADGVETSVYYKQAAAYNAETPDNNDHRVFQEYKITGDIDNLALSDYEDATIVVTAYAVQHEGFTTAAAAWDVAKKATAYTPNN